MQYEQTALRFVLRASAIPWRWAMYCRRCAAAGCPQLIATRREVAYYHARVTAERRSQEQEDDQAADAVRLMAPDVLAGSQGEGTTPRAS